MTSPTNGERAQAAAYGLDTYSKAKEGRADYDDPVDMAADLICDLLHLIRSHDGDPLKKLAMAQTNFEAEEDERRCRMTNLVKTHHRTYSLLQNVAAISGDFHTHTLYHCFYDAFGKQMDGFIGNYDICIEMARAVSDWEAANGGSGAYDDLGTPWIEIVEHFVEVMILRSIETGEIQNARFILNSVLKDGGAA
jgi:hypothetical protein